MKRFIDLSGQIMTGSGGDCPTCGRDLPEDGEYFDRAFAFYDTVRSEFEKFSGSQDWSCWQDFEEDYDGDQLERYRGLCAAWVFREKGY